MIPRRFAESTLCTLVALFAWGQGRRRAEGCSAINCQPLVELPPVGHRFTADAVGFHALGRLAKGDASGLEIRDDQGTVIPASVQQIAGQAVFGPVTSPLPAGLYNLVYDRRCFPLDGSDLPAPLPADRSFFVFSIEAVTAAPRNTGELAVIERGTAGQTRFVRLRAFLSDEIYARSAGLFLDLDVDGKAFGGLDRLAIADATVITLECGADWSVDTCGLPNTVPPGTHRIELVPRLIATPIALPPAVLDLDVCAGVAETRPAATTPNADAGVASHGGTAVGASEVAGAGPSTGGGCSLAGRPASAFAWLAAAAWLQLLRTGRRVRRSLIAQRSGTK